MRQQDDSGPTSTPSPLVKERKETVLQRRRQQRPTEKENVEPRSPRAGKGREGGAKVGEEKKPRGLIGLRNNNNCRSNPLVLTRFLRFMLAYYDDWALRR